MANPGSAPWSGLGPNLGNLWQLAEGESRSITPENPTGERGVGGSATTGTGNYASMALGPGWKVSPAVDIGPGQTHVIADIEGSGAVQHIWATPVRGWRDQVLRMYWDGSDHPQVECPIGDFFGNGWEVDGQLNSIAMSVNPRSGFNCYFEMPFESGARITVTNESHHNHRLYYQVDYTLCDVPTDAARFCAQWRRVPRLDRGQAYTIVDGIEGRGQYVGTSCSWGSNSPGWWGEGEVKFYIDDDETHPTICGTGVEDYFGGSYNFEVGGRYQAFSGAFAGMPFVDEPAHRSQSRFGLYRWHVPDPIRFRNRLTVTMQALGWGPDHRYRHLADDIATVAYWYQTLPTAPFPPLPPAPTRRPPD